MEKQPEEPAVAEPVEEAKSPEEPVAEAKSSELVTETEVQEKPNEKDSANEEEKSEQKEASGDGSEKVEEEKPDEELVEQRDEPERKKEDDPEETAEEFEDAVDTVGEPDDIEFPDHFGGDSSTRSSRRGSVRSDGAASSSDEQMPRLRVTESETVEIESSPEKSPKTVSKAPRPGPSKVIETVDLDDDEEEYDEDRSFEEDDEDDYYDDPESDDQDVNRVIQDAVDEIDAMDSRGSGEEDKMDVSSDDDGEDYSDYDDDDRRRSVVESRKGSDKRKRGGSDYSEGEIYDADDGDEYDQVGEVDEPGRSYRPSRSRGVSLGQISVDDDSEEEKEKVSPKKKAGGKVKYKSYRQKLVAGIRKRTLKILNKRSMHVMEEGSDATLVCSSADATAAKVVSLKSSSVATPNATTSSKSPAPEEARLSGKPESPREAALVDSKKGSSSDENKENMTVKDIEVATAKVVEEKVKPAKDDEKKREGSGEDVMSGMEIEEDQQDCTYRNGSKTEDFNDELTFQMDGGSGAGSQQSSNGDDDTEEGDDDEEQEEQGAVDLSSSTETVNKPEEPAESSSEKSVTKTTQKPEVPVEEPDLSSVEKTVKVEPMEQPEERREEAPTVDLSSKTSRKEKPVSRKRRRSVEEYEDEEDAEPVMPSKKLKRELECNFRAHDLLLKEYIENTSNDSMEDVHKNTELLQVEIQTLNDMIRAKENEWNNMIHLKKVKEEILMRLTRKKNVLNIVHTKLGEEPPADYSLSNVRSASVGPRPPTPPPEVDIRPASVTPLHSSRQSANTSTANDSRRSAPSTNSSSLFAQFNHINSSVTMVPLSTSPSLITSTNTILQSRANMKPAELAKEKPNAAQIQRQILPKPILSNHQQILNNLAMSAGLTAANVTSSTISNTTSSASSSNTMAAAAIAANNILAGLGLSAQAAALLNGHHNPGGHQNQHNINNQLQVGRQGVIKDVKSIIADYRQKHPEQVPRRGRRLKNIPSYDGKGGSSADARMRELSFLLAAAENTSRPSSNDSSQSNSNAPPPTTLPGAVSFKDVLVQFAKMSQSDRSLLSSLSSLSNAVTAAAAVASAGGTSVATTTNCSSSSQQRSSGGGESAVPSMGKGGAYPEVTLHPVMNSASSNSTALPELNLSNGGTSANQSQAANSTSNSLLHGILTKSASRPNPATTATSGPGFTSFSPTLARLLTAPERMNSAAAAQQQAATVTSGALANLQASTGLNLSKSNSEITITPVGGGNGGSNGGSTSIQASLLQAAAAHQQLQEQQKQLQRLREQHFMSMDDEAEDSVDRLVIDEGDDHHGHHDGHVNNSGGGGGGHHQRNHRGEPSVVITARGSGGGNGPEFHENDVPECQGCKKREAQFVCAGCGNQWYCSRECQVNAWDDHSEVCTG
ncbi:uncharacterized protein LOC120417006 isoform X1 [Culex pipiens pallens]|uniref:uncharacterized protein LOC120417006 isoform X1 n=1 Tax=Culex pipiens pallens TaxID=42434 RepID=UPI001953AD89|nr:uncharacterized protein LOC120417006 isoform X1 [Culex pipiens pallens]